MNRARSEKIDDGLERITPAFALRGIIKFPFHASKDTEEKLSSAKGDYS